MPKIVVAGGTGLIGTKLVAALAEQGHTAVAASPSRGVDVVTGAGLADALRDADVVIDATNSPSFEDAAALKFFQTAGRNLLAAEAVAGVRHHVTLSIVGLERNLASGYFVAKMAQEQLVQAGGIPYTIVRATQFFEFIASMGEAGEYGASVRMSPALVQPIAADDVVTELVAVCGAAPRDGTIEIAGPERLPLATMIERYLRAHKDTRPVVADPHAKYFGLELDDRSLTPGAEPLVGQTNFETWLIHTLAP